MVSLSLAATAQAAPAERRFTVRPQATSEALIDFALQADISVGGVAACKGRSPALVGSYTLREGLLRLTADASCRFKIVDSHTVRFFAAAPPRSLAPTPPHPIAPAQPIEVSELMVTATKRAVSFDRAPASVSRVGGDSLDATGSTDAAGAVRQIAGVTMTNLGPGRDKIMLRGLSDGAFTGRTRSTVGTYLDDVPITYNAPDPDLRLADVDGVEVLRGPQGALYGGGSLSGVYRIVTRKPDLDTLGGGVRVLHGWTKGGSPSTEVEGVLNVPIIEDELAMRVVAYHDVKGGYLDNEDRRQANVDRTTRTGGRASITARLSSHWTVTGAVNLQRLSTNDTQYIERPLGQYSRANRVAETHSNRFGQAALVVNGEGDWGRFQSTTAYVNHSFASQYDASAALGIADTAIAKDLGVYNENTRIGMVVQDAFWASPERGRWRWLLGVYGSSTQERSPSTLRAYANGNGPMNVLYQENRNDRIDELALYGEAAYQLTPRLTLAAGGRAFHTELHTRSQVTVTPPGRARNLDRSDTFEGFSPKISLQYDFKTNGSAYLLYSEGYRPGGFNSAGFTPPQPNRRTYEPDRLQNIEAGVKLRLFDRKLELRSSVFYDIWKDIQSDQYLPSGLAYTTNVGDGENLGLETEATWQVSPELTVQANALFNRPRVTRLNPAFASKVGYSLPGVPDISAGVLVLYSQPINDKLSMLYTAQANYIGASRLTFDPAFSPEMGDYVTAELSAQLRGDRWRIGMFLSNPFNTAGDTFAYGNPFSFGKVRQITPQRPRTLSLVLTASF